MKVDVRLALTLIIGAAISMELALEAGAEDVSGDEESWEVVTSPEDFNAVLEAIKGAGIEPVSSEVLMRPAMAG